MLKEYTESRNPKRSVIENEIKALNLKLPNGTVSREYKFEFKLPAGKVMMFRLNGLDELGLKWRTDGQCTCTVEGKPVKAGSFNITLQYRPAGWLPGESNSEIILPVTFNKENKSEKIDHVASLMDRLGYKVEGKYKPMRHQVASAIFMAEHRRCFNLSTMRTGKTGSTLLAYRLLRSTKRARKMLVLAPLSTLRAVWYDSTLLIPDTESLLLVGSKKKMIAGIQDNPDIIIANYEKVKTYYDELSAWSPDIVCIDECTAYANVTTARSKLIRKFLQAVGEAHGAAGVRVWGLTGTPGHDPLKVYGMVRAINPLALGPIKSQYQWRELTQYKVNKYEWANRPEAKAMMKGILKPAIRFDAKDVLDLPKVTKEAQYAEATTDITVAVRDLQESLIAFYRGQTVTVQQASSCVVRCLQLLCGVVRTEAGGVTTTFTDTPRDHLITELIDSTTRKTVIFSPFTDRCHALTDYLNSRGYRTECVTGETPEKKRTMIFNAFQNETSPRVLVCHPRTVAFGVELAAADLMIFDGVCLSGDFTYGQALARLSSAKQTSRHIHVVHVFSSQLELEMIRKLVEGQKQSAVIADAFTMLTKERLL